MMEDAKPNVCIDCGGMGIGGEPMHCMQFVVYLKEGKKQVSYEYRCQDCLDKFARDVWPEEWGSRPNPIMPRSRGVQ